MKIYYHSDDIGATTDITKRILQTWKDGLLDGYSIIANGEAVSDIECELSRNAGKEARISVHLNLSEGKSIVQPELISFLVDSSGNLNHGFVSLLILWLKSSKKNRKLILKQIEDELRAQIRKVKDICSPRQITCVDGHNHIHMLPFVFPIAARLAKEEGVREVRISREVFFLSPRIRDSFQLSFFINILKHVVLKVFSWRAIPVANEYGLISPDGLLGILYTGIMSEAAARGGIKAAERRGIERLEIVFHIGRANKQEARRWAANQRTASFYDSERRDQEFEILKRLRRRIPNASN